MAKVKAKSAADSIIETLGVVGTSDLERVAEAASRHADESGERNEAKAQLRKCLADWEEIQNAD